MKAMPNSMWKIKIAALVFLTVLLSCEDGQTGLPDAKIKIVNASDYTLSEIRLNEIGTDEWTDNILSAPLVPNQNISREVDRVIINMDAKTEGGLVLHAEAIDMRFVKETYEVVIK